MFNIYEQNSIYDSTLKIQRKGTVLVIQATIKHNSSNKCTNSLHTYGNCMHSFDLNLTKLGNTRLSSCIFMIQSKFNF